MTKLGFHAAAMLYTGGTLAQVLHLVYDFPWQEMPYAIDWVIVVLGTLGAYTLARHTSRIAYRGLWEKVLHFLIIIHLSASVIAHLWTIGVQNHDFFSAFPYGYSYFAATYFACFAWRMWTIKLLKTDSTSSLTSAH